MDDILLQQGEKIIMYAVWECGDVLEFLETICISDWQLCEFFLYIFFGLWYVHVHSVHHVMQ